MTTVRLFRDILIGESGGQKVSEYNPQESIPKMLDEAFNAGIDRAIQSIKETKGVIDGSPEQHIHQRVISQLESLKKK